MESSQQALSQVEHNTQLNSNLKNIKFSSIAKMIKHRNKQANGSQLFKMPAEC